MGSFWTDPKKVSEEHKEIENNEWNLYNELAKNKGAIAPSVPQTLDEAETTELEESLENTSETSCDKNNDEIMILDECSQESTVHETSGDFKCQICMTDFPNFEELAEHVEEKHYNSL